MSSKRDKHAKVAKSSSSIRKAAAVKSKSSRSLPVKVSSSSTKKKKSSAKDEASSRRHRHHHRVARSPSPSSEDSSSESESEREEERRPSRHHHRSSSRRHDDDDSHGRRHRHRRSSQRSDSGSDGSEEEEEIIMPRRTRQTRVQKGPTPAEARTNAAVASAVAAALSASGGQPTGGQPPVHPSLQAPIPAAVALSKSVTDEAIRASLAADAPVAAPESAGSREVHDAVKEANQADTVNSAELATVLDEEKPSSGKNKHGSGSGVDYAAAYGELFTCLSTRMVDRIYRYFQDLYDVKCHRNEAVFKKQLSLIPSWNQAQIDEKTRELVKRHPSIVSYFKFAYAANVLLMSVVVQRDEESEDVSVDVPKFTEFVHRSYSESALKIFDYAGVFDPTLPPGERLSIRNELYRCFGDALSTSLRIMVPLEKIAPGAIDTDGAGGDGGGGEFEDMMRGDASEEEEEEEEVEEEKTRSKKHKRFVVEETEDEEDDSDSNSDSEDGSGSEEDSDEDTDEDSDEESENFSSSEEEEEPEVRPERRRKHNVAAPRDTLAFF